MLRAALGRTRDPLVVRWLVLRGLGILYLSVFVSLACEIHGLIGPHGILPARDYLTALHQETTRLASLWYAPTLLWISSSDAALTALVVAGLVGSCALLLNLWPRAALALAAVTFLSFVAAAGRFSGFQSDGMLLEASAVALVLAPRGLRPGLGAASPPSPLALFFWRWEWFRIYFESGLVKMLSGETQWRDFTAMIKYYENGPLPTWLGWYAQQTLPRGFHVATAFCTVAGELVLPFTMFLPRRLRVPAFGLASAFQIGIIATGNYAFLNYLVLLLGVTLLCDLPPFAPRPRWRRVAGGIVAGLYGYATVAVFALRGGLWALPAELAEPFRIANAYGLFAVMTRARYELEFQGTLDGKTWVPYPFRFKPQDRFAAPGVYAPYQPRFEWCLWFASLDTVDDDPWVLTVAERLRDGEPAVLSLFARDPFAGKKPLAVRTVEYRYWFTTPAEKRATGAWWNRELVGPYAPTVGRGM